MSDYRFGDDYRLNIDLDHQAKGWCYGYDEPDWGAVEWVEIEAVEFVKRRTCLVDGVRDGGFCGSVTYRLSCGHAIALAEGERLSFCPKCGAKVVNA